MFNDKQNTNKQKDTTSIQLKKRERRRKETQYNNTKQKSVSQPASEFTIVSLSIWMKRRSQSVHTVHSP